MCAAMETNKHKGGKKGKKVKTPRHLQDKKTKVKIKKRLSFPCKVNKEKEKRGGGQRRTEVHVQREDSCVTLLFNNSLFFSLTFPPSRGSCARVRTNQPKRGGCYKAIIKGRPIHPTHVSYMEPSSSFSFPPCSFSSLLLKRRRNVLFCATRLLCSGGEVVVTDFTQLS